LKVVKISNSKLSVVVVLAVVFDMIVLAIWDQRSPITAVLQEIDSNSKLHHYTHCSPSSDGVVYFWILMFTKILSLLFGACIGFATRNVNQLFNESKSVAAAIWNVFFTILVLVPIMLLLGTIGDALIGVVLFLIVWVSIGTYSFMFLNKFLSLAEWKSFQSHTSTGGQSSHAPLISNGGFSFLSFHGLGTDTLVRYISECERHMAQAKKLYIKLGGGSAFFQSLHYLDPLHQEGESIQPRERESETEGSSRAPHDHAVDRERSATVSSMLREETADDVPTHMQTYGTTTRRSGATPNAPAASVATAKKSTPAK
jgi:hypothetical protein